MSTLAHCLTVMHTNTWSALASRDHRGPTPGQRCAAHGPWVGQGKIFFLEGESVKEGGREENSRKDRVRERERQSERVREGGRQRERERERER